MSWYRTYRPQTIAGLQIKPVREAMQQILSSGEFSHAYLLTGPKGTGKTSAARILAKVLNCTENRSITEQILQKSSKKQVVSSKDKKENASHSLHEPCNVCASCLSITDGSSLSVTEIDAASNRGIDDIRLLRERIGLAPPDGIISVFIIDEVHMLTTEAFNALLKALEEPPKHVVFILATTDAQKMPATVLSRCTIISYRKATAGELREKLEQIAQAEQIVVDTAILDTIATTADGSFRDAVKLFEQIAAGKRQVSESDLEAAVGIGSQRLAADLLMSLLRHDAAAVASLFDSLRERGMDGVTFEREVLSLGHSKLVEFAKANDPRLATIVSLLRAIATPIDTNLPTVWLPFELACMEYAMQGVRGQGQGDREKSPPHAREDHSHGGAGRGQSHENTEARDPLRLSEASEGKETQVIEKQETVREVKKKEKVETVEPEEEVAVTVDFESIKAQWPTILTKVKTRSVPVEGLLKSARPMGLEGRNLILEVAYQFHKDQLEQTKNTIVLEEILEESLGSALRFQVRIAKTKIQKLPSSQTSEIVGSSEDLVDAAQAAFL